jgi:RNA polymerase sigma-54 factor
MKQSIHLRLGQQLTMTPQLQQAIKLLQMSTLDLQQEIQQALDSNMMLELDEDDGVFQLAPADSTVKTESSETLLDSDGMQLSMPDELPVDAAWEDTYEEVMEASSHTADNQEFEGQRGYSATLHDHLLWQLELTRFSDRDHAIAMAIIDAIDDDGYLIMSPEEICLGLHSQLEDVELDEVYAVLHRVQQFDPTGVAALNLGDCLRLQLQQMPVSTPFREEALLVVVKYLNLLASHDRSKLMAAIQLDERQLNAVVMLIRSLDPKPGAKIHETTSEYVVPDVYVNKQNGCWQVNLNPEIAPKLRINPFYSNLIKRADNSRDNACMRDHLQEARWFIKSLHSRNDTLLRVARSIVARQQDFLEHGSIAMKPMVLKAIADELSLHESTISRVTTQKYMHTPSGIVEFKYFFSSHVSTDEGGECSSTAIRAFIKELVSNENPAKPLSDDKMSKLLQEKGINVARRTIAKYREAMLIAPSNERKRIL